MSPPMFSSPIASISRSIDASRRDQLPIIRKSRPSDSIPGRASTLASVQVERDVPERIEPAHGLEGEARAPGALQWQRHPPKASFLAADALAEQAARDKDGGRRWESTPAKPGTGLCLIQRASLRLAEICWKLWAIPAC